MIRSLRMKFGWICALLIRSPLRLPQLPISCDNSLVGIKQRTKNKQFSFINTQPYSEYKTCSPGLNVAVHWRFSKWENSGKRSVIDHSGNMNIVLFTGSVI